MPKIVNQTHGKGITSFFLSKSVQIKWKQAEKITFRFKNDKENDSKITVKSQINTSSMTQ